MSRMGMLLAGALSVAALGLPSAASAKDCKHCRHSHCCSDAVSAPVVYVGAASAQTNWPGTTRYFTAPDRRGNWSSSLYPSPRPVPAYTGHVFYTYPPLYPHHYLYDHGHFYYGKGTLAFVTYSSW